MGENYHIVDTEDHEGAIPEFLDKIALLLATHPKVSEIYLVDREKLCIRFTDHSWLRVRLMSGER